MVHLVLKKCEISEIKKPPLKKEAKEGSKKTFLAPIQNS